MNFLAVETSGREGTIALLTQGQQPIQHALASDGRRHAQTLVADARDLLIANDLGPGDADCIAVSMGPGSFTGLRVGIVFAKTFGWINKCPIVAIPTFSACAMQAGTDSEHICVVGDAQRGEVFFGEFTIAKEQPHSLVEVQILPLAEARSRLTPKSVLTGPALTKYAAEFRDVCRLADETVWTPQASTIATLGVAAFEIGNTADPWKLEPFYLRRSAAEEKRDLANTANQ